MFTLSQVIALYFLMITNCRPRIHYVKISFPHTPLLLANDRLLPGYTCSIKDPLLLLWTSLALRGLLGVTNWLLTPPLQDRKQKIKCSVHYRGSQPFDYTAIAATASAGRES